MKKRFNKSVASVILAAAMSVTAVFGGVPSDVTTNLGLVLEAEAAENTNSPLASPTEKDVDDDSKNEMVWNCIYFGEYPQSKVIGIFLLI